MKISVTSSDFFLYLMLGWRVTGYVYVGHILYAYLERDDDKTHRHLR